MIHCSVYVVLQVLEQKHIPIVLHVTARQCSTVLLCCLVLIK